MSSDLTQLIATMQPVLHPGTYAFVAPAPDAHIPWEQIIAFIREAEGPSLVIPEPLARSLDLPVAYTAAWITLEVHSDLAAVGFTAAFATALGADGISCNVIAGVHHDHLFVPAAQAELALRVLSQLQASSMALLPRS